MLQSYPISVGRYILSKVIICVNIGMSALVNYMAYATRIPQIKMLFTVCVYTSICIYTCVYIYVLSMHLSGSLCRSKCACVFVCVSVCVFVCVCVVAARNLCACACVRLCVSRGCIEEGMTHCTWTCGFEE